MEDDLIQIHILNRRKIDGNSLINKDQYNYGNKFSGLICSMFIFIWEQIFINMNKLITSTCFDGKLMNFIGSEYDLRFSRIVNFKVGQNVFSKFWSKNLLKFKQSTFDIALLVYNVSRTQCQIPVVMATKKQLKNLY